MRTLLITDLHLNSKIPGLLDSQVSCFHKILKDENPDDVIIMGDVFMHRKPTPSELLSFKEILKEFVHILRTQGDQHGPSPPDFPI